MRLNRIIQKINNKFKTLYKYIENYIFRYKIYKIQNKNIKENYKREEEKLIVFLVPGIIEINGGIMSICSIAKITEKLEKLHTSKVMIVNLPKGYERYEYTQFETPFKVYRFKQIFSYFKNLKQIELHIPEYVCNKFYKLLDKEEINRLSSLEKIKINILNQNIKLMPSYEEIKDLMKITSNLTMTIAHKKYCTKELRNQYKMPVHMLSADYLAEYKIKNYKLKKDIIIYSPDAHPLKIKIINKIKKELSSFKLVEIKNMKYKEYLKIISEAKYAITFGEGLDGYFLEPIRCGGISFATYNKDFFSDIYIEIPTLYESYEEMFAKIVDDICTIEKTKNYDELSKKLCEIQNKEYSREEYIENIELYYKEQYTYE